MLAALNAGPAAIRDLETALADVLSAFRPGKGSWLTSFLTRRIDRIAFAATKADHVHHTDHDNLAKLLERLTRRAAERAAFSGAKVRIVPLAAVRATREVTVNRGGERLPAIAGVPMPGERVEGDIYDGETEIALFPGDLPADPEAIFEVPGPTDERQLMEEALALRFLRFRPPQLERTAEGVTLSLPHIRLDQTLQFLIGDKLA
jgi:predicted YcjX-like family ATPase